MIISVNLNQINLSFYNIPHTAVRLHFDNKLRRAGTSQVAPTRLVYPALCLFPTR